MVQIENQEFCEHKKIKAQRLEDETKICKISKQRQIYNYALFNGRQKTLIWCRNNRLKVRHSKKFLLTSKLFVKLLNGFSSK